MEKLPDKVGWEELHAGTGAEVLRGISSPQTFRAVATPVPTAYVPYPKIIQKQK